jgi:hypothetical protein
MAAVQLLNVDGQFTHPAGGAIFMGGMCLAIAYIGVYFGFKLHAERLRIGPDAFEFRRWGRSQILAPDDVVHAEWQRAPTRGKLVLRTSRSRFSISFDDYKAEHVELIAAFRAFLPKAVQEGWPAFEFRYFPDAAERQRRREQAEKPLSWWVVAPMFGLPVLLLANTVWLVVAEKFERPRLAGVAAAAVMLVGVLWTVFDWRRAKRKQINLKRADGVQVTDARELGHR